METLKMDENRSSPLSMCGYVGINPAYVDSNDSSSVSSNLFNESFREVPRDDLKVTASPPKRKPRKFVPESEKDETYLRKRLLNNEAAKKSRNKRRELDNKNLLKVQCLKEENLFLIQKLVELSETYNLDIKEIFQRPQASHCLASSRSNRHRSHRHEPAESSMEPFLPMSDIKISPDFRNIFPAHAGNGLVRNLDHMNADRLENARSRLTAQPPENRLPGYDTRFGLFKTEFRNDATDAINFTPPEREFYDESFMLASPPFLYKSRHANQPSLKRLNLPPAQPPPLIHPPSSDVIFKARRHESLFE